MLPPQTYEVIGSPPNVSVPTHFAKVVLAAKPSSPATPDVFEVSTGAFVLPNAPIPDGAPLEGFVLPGERSRERLGFVWPLNSTCFLVDAVERAAGITLFSDAIKSSSKHICKTAKCELVVRKFDDTRKRPELRRALSSPN
jgi:endonuclease G